MEAFHSLWARWCTQASGKSAFRCFQPCHDPEVRAAIKRNDSEALSSLLDRPRCLGLAGGDINVPLDGADGSALHMAAETASEPLVRTLLERGAQVNSVNMAGETPLHLAARRGSVAVVEALLDAVVQIDALDHEDVEAPDLVDRLDDRLRVLRCDATHVFGCLPMMSAVSLPLR